MVIGSYLKKVRVISYMCGLQSYWWLSVGYMGEEEDWGGWIDQLGGCGNSFVVLMMSDVIYMYLEKFDFFFRIKEL